MTKSMLTVLAAVLVIKPNGVTAFPSATRGFTAKKYSSLSRTTLSLKKTSHYEEVSRRSLLKETPPLVLGFLGASFGSTFVLPEPAAAVAAEKIKGAGDGNLPDLPPEASRSYLQYRFGLQLAVDYYVFELKDKVGRIDDWGEVNQLFQTNNNKGQGQPNKIERDYTNTMRILALSFPPDEADELRDAQFKFEKAMQKISKAVAGVRRDLPVELDTSVVVDAKSGWEEGRVALNEFLSVINSVTGMNEMRLIPSETKTYGRSERRYFELAKKTKLCQNRGGPALSQAWGQLMVSGYLQENMDSCGIPDPVEYFYQ